VPVDFHFLVVVEVGVAQLAVHAEGRLFAKTGKAFGEK